MLSKLVAWAFPQHVEREAEAHMVTVREVVRRTANENGLSYNDLVGERRYRSIVRVRAIAAERLRERGLSLPEIGLALGGRHHTTIMNLLKFEPTRVGPKKAPCWDGNHLCKDCA